MANLTLELTINSASNLANVNLITKMDVYAVVTINGDDTRKKQKVKTAVDRSGGSNPTWDHAVKFSVNERLARDGRLTLGMRLMCRRVLGNKRIGEVNVPLPELLNDITPAVNGDGNIQGMKFVTYQVRTPSGKRRGSLTFSYRFNTPAIVNRISVNQANILSTTYPPPPAKSVSLPSHMEHPPTPPASVINYRQLSLPPHQKNPELQKHSAAAGSSSNTFPVSYDAALTSSPYFCSPASHKSDYALHRTLPPQSSNAYLPPPTHYSYAPPSPAGYGYGGPLSEPAKGIGLGLGLGAGLLSGLMMGDLVSDVANCFDL